MKGRSKGKVMILIVDDEELILMGWKYALESAGYNVRTALTGINAISIAQRERPDIVITDLIMPKMNGVEICRKIKEKSPGTEVVLVSGHPEEIKNFQTDFINAGGMDLLLKKPLSTDEIVGAVKVIMKEKT